MKKMENNNTVKRYKIPQDVLMDILRILFGNNIKHQITGIKEKENIVLLSIYFKEDAEKHQKAEKNIEAILKDYSEYMKGLMGDNTLFMDEEEEQE